MQSLQCWRWQEKGMSSENGALTVGQPPRPVTEQQHSTYVDFASALAGVPALEPAPATCLTSFARTNMPCLSGHLKYVTSLRVPLFLPFGTSSSIPHHVPVANFTACT